MSTDWSEARSLTSAPGRARPLAMPRPSHAVKNYFSHRKQAPEPCPPSCAGFHEEMPVCARCADGPDPLPFPLPPANSGCPVPSPVSRWSSWRHPTGQRQRRTLAADGFAPSAAKKSLEAGRGLLGVSAPRLDGTRPLGPSLTPPRGPPRGLPRRRPVMNLGDPALRSEAETFPPPNGADALTAMLHRAWTGPGASCVPPGSPEDELRAAVAAGKGKMTKTSRSVHEEAPRSGSICQR